MTGPASTAVHPCATAGCERRGPLEGAACCFPCQAGEGHARWCDLANPEADR